MKPKLDGFVVAKARLLLAGLALAVTASSAVSAAAPATTDRKKASARECFDDPAIRVFQIEISEEGLASRRSSPRACVQGTVREVSHL
jgi:hypothetical protein